MLKLTERNADMHNEDTKMKSIRIEEIHQSGYINLSTVKELLEIMPENHRIDNNNWSAFPYKPSVLFKIAYWENHILLKFSVKDDYIVGKEVNTNGDVHKDSCVEFFISITGDNYYNFEFNCIGTSKLG